MALAAGLTDDVGDSWETIVIRAVAGLLACLSAVAAEALWNARPWAHRASPALAPAFAAAVTPLSLGVYGLDGLLATIGIPWFGACVVVPIVMYVRNRSAKPFGPQRRQTRPAPMRAVARPVAPGGRKQPWW